MNILLEIINSLDKEEIRFYKLFAGRTNSGDTRKDILLFDFIKQNREEYDEQIISEELYKDNKNSFYQLKNRLYKDLNKSMMLQHMGKEKDIFILHFVLLSRIYKRKGKVELSFHYLKKAEKEAEKKAKEKGIKEDEMKTEMMAGKMNAMKEPMNAMMKAQAMKMPIRAIVSDWHFLPYYLLSSLY